MSAGASYLHRQLGSLGDDARRSCCVARPVGSGDGLGWWPLFLWNAGWLGARPRVSPQAHYFIINSLTLKTRYTEYTTRSLMWKRVTTSNYSPQICSQGIALEGGAACQASGKHLRHLMRSPLNAVCLLSSFLSIWQSISSYD